MEKAEFRPSLLLRSPHVQSVLASIWPRRSSVRRRALVFSRHSQDVIVDCGDGTRLLGHLNRPAAVKENGRTIVMIHGWEGSGESTYILSVAPKLLELGYTIFRLNLRDHGDSHHLNEDLFHSCRLDEVVGAMKWIRRQEWCGELALVGFSLGGNFALRVAAVAGEMLRLRRVVSVCAVLNPAQTMIALDRGWFVYHDYFLRRWSESLRKKSRAFPGRFKFGRLTRFTNLTDMTAHFVEQHTEYADLYSYLNGYSLSGERLASLSVDATLLLADDDPVIPVEGLADMTMPPRLRVVRTLYGGHCGFLDGWSLDSWLDQFVIGELEHSRWI